MDFITVKIRGKRMKSVVASTEPPPANGTVYGKCGNPHTIQKQQEENPHFDQPSSQQDNRPEASLDPDYAMTSKELTPRRTSHGR